LLENPKFATELTQTPLRELMIKKSFKFSTPEFTNAIFTSQNKKFSLRDSSPGEEGVFPVGSGTHPTPFGALSPQL